MTDVLIVAPFAAQIAERLGPIPAGLKVAVAASLAEAPADLNGVRGLIVLPSMVNRELLQRMPRLEWLQALTAGIDAMNGIQFGNVAVTTMGGVHAPQMSELAFIFMFTFARDLRAMFARQARAEWRQEPQRVLVGARVVIVGVGGIAEALARRCRVFDMHVTGVSSSRTEAPNFDRILARDRLREAAAEADYFVVLAPYTPRNHHLVSREVLAALPRSAVLINIARGPLVDEAALIEALSEKRIAGAGLDVFDREPLPPDHPFWRMPNVMVTPHIGGWNTRVVEQLAPVVTDNIGRWFGTPRRPLRNQVSAVT
jgi:phosphoglycerate dehydrogenase-like enzyme